MKSGRETQRGGLGSSHTILGNLSFIYGQRDAQEGFRAGSAVIRSMLFLKALLRLNFSINLGAFERWCWRRLLRITWVARRSNQSILKEISLEYSLEQLMYKLKLQYFGHLIE